MSISRESSAVLAHIAALSATSATDALPFWSGSVAPISTLAAGCLSVSKHECDCASCPQHVHKQVALDVPDAATALARGLRSNKLTCCILWAGASDRQLQSKE